MGAVGSRAAPGEERGAVDAIGVNTCVVTTRLLEFPSLNPPGPASSGTVSAGRRLEGIEAE